MDQIADEGVETQAKVTQIEEKKKGRGR
uniref:Uncharacterized protein n=1 Tax=Arundo donax TaxID=35708 RepID=A0A0A9BTW7_ARUDO